jgi:hypothetical protein
LTLGFLILLAGLAAARVAFVLIGVRVAPQQVGTGVPNA